MIGAVIKKFFRRQPDRGFVYVPHVDTGPMANVAAGQRIQIPGRAPPWIVVDQVLASIVIARWPGRLWAVEVVDPMTNSELRAAGHGPLRSDARYVRAAAVKVLHELPVATLFGQHGAKVCAVIEAAANLTVERAVRLVGARHPNAGRTQTRVWKLWLKRNGAPANRYGDNLDGTLSVPGTPSKSPVGAGLLVIKGEVGRRAEAIGGPSVWLTDDVDPEGAWLAQPWLGGSIALLDAALAFGAPNLMNDDDRNVLAAAWRDVVGPDPV
jgi:hypothetical protein